MKLTRGAFERKWSEGELRIALIGMSNVGKSRLAMKLSEGLDVPVIEVDEKIRALMNHASMADFADWLGHPDSPGYAEREAESLALEEKATLAALDMLPSPGILDTTGSVIYCPRSCERLKATTYIVYLRASGDQSTRLKKLYFSNPKPLNWGGSFDQEAGESFDDAMARSYPNLLTSRDDAYSALADHIVMAETLREGGDPNALFDLLKPARE